MQKSESIVSIAKAMHLFHVKMGTILFDSVNPFFNSKYASLTRILEAIKDPLSECGLVLFQMPCEENGLTTTLVHAESGEYISSTYFMKPEKITPQAMGSIVSYQRRYCIQSILCLSFDEDDDGNYATHGNNAPQSKQKQPDDLPWLNEGTDMYKAAVQKLATNQTTIQKIKLAFKLSKKVQDSLLTDVAKMQEGGKP